MLIFLPQILNNKISEGKLNSISRPANTAAELTLFSSFHSLHAQHWSTRQALRQIDRLVLAIDREVREETNLSMMIARPQPILSYKFRQHSRSQKPRERLDSHSNKVFLENISSDLRFHLMTILFSEAHLYPSDRLLVETEYN